MIRLAIPALVSMALLAPPAAISPKVQIPAGTVVRVRMEQTLDTARNRAGDRFTADLTEPVRVNGKLVLPKGARFRGRVTEGRPSGRLRGRASLAVVLDSVSLNGRTYALRTSGQGRQSGARRNRNLAWIGGGAGGGSLIAGLAAGGPWTLAGAGIGAGAGLATAAITGRKQVAIPAETVLSFTLKQPVTVDYQDTTPSQTKSRRTSSRPSSQ
jgi:hypothetical protein